MNQHKAHETLYDCHGNPIEPLEIVNITTKRGQCAETHGVWIDNRCNINAHHDWPIHPIPKPYLLGIGAALLDTQDDENEK